MIHDRRLLKWALWTLASCGLVAWSGCGEPPEAASAVAPPERAAALVETMTLVDTTYSDAIELVGETRPIRTASLSSEVPGRIISLDVEEGQRVQAGANVLRIDTSTQSAQTGAIEAQIRQVENDLERNRRLLERGIGTAANVEALESQREVLREQVRQVSVGVRQARTQAPISGIVIEKLAEPGEYASPGVPLAHIVDIDTIVVHVGLPEREIGFVREGMRLDVRIDATGEHFEGTLAEIGIQANPASRTFPLKIHVDNADLRIRAGMRATVQIPKRELRDVVVIPRDAILQTIDGQEVFVVEDNVALTRSIDLGPGRGSFVVIEQGLREGDVLVVRGQRSLVTTERVTTIDIGECCDEQLASYISGLADRAAQRDSRAGRASGRISTGDDPTTTPDAQPDTSAITTPTGSP